MPVQIVPIRNLQTFDGWNSNQFNSLPPANLNLSASNSTAFDFYRTNCYLPASIASDLVHGIIPSIIRELRRH